MLELGAAVVDGGERAQGGDSRVDAEFLAGGEGQDLDGLGRGC